MHLDVIAAADLDSAARAEIIALCETAYREDFSRLFEELPGSVHVLARDEHGELVSHAEWVTRWLQPANQPILCTAYVEASMPDMAGSSGRGRLQSGEMTASSQH